MEKYVDYINNHSMLYPKVTFGAFRNILPDELFNELVTITDKILSESIDDARKLLAGRIYKGKQASILNYLSEDFKAYVIACCKKYVDVKNLNSTIQENIDCNKLRFHSSWVVSQYEEDYNPVHTHTGLLSGIIYIKVPEVISTGSKRETIYLENEDKARYDGRLNFIFDNITINRQDYVSNWVVTPQEKNMYVFPSWLMHAVYPYKGDGERRCVSFNLI